MSACRYREEMKWPKYVDCKSLVDKECGVPGAKKRKGSNVYHSNYTVDPRAPLSESQPLFYFQAVFPTL